MDSEGDKNEEQQNITPNDETQEKIKQNENNTENEKEKEGKEKVNSEKAAIVYPCGVCEDLIDFEMLSGIFCEKGCKKWIHTKCTKLKSTSTMTAYQKLKYKCPKCEDKQREHTHRQPKENEKVPKKLQHYNHVWTRWRIIFTDIVGSEYKEKNKYYNLPP